MAQLVKKTPMELFGSEKAQVKPNAYVGRGSRINAPKDKLPENGVSPLYYGNRVTYTKLYNGMPSQAQKSANVEGKPVGTHDPKMSRFLPRTKGKYGQIRLPEQWKYKTGTELATAMTRMNKVDPEEERSWGPSKDRQKYEDIIDEIYGPEPEPTKID